MALSALYHTFSCRSEHDYNTFLMYDLFGIALSLLAIYTSGVYYAFWCHHVSMACLILYEYSVIDFNIIYINIVI